jgi:hypothetical protein
MFLISLVSVLVLANIAVAADWTGLSDWSDLWNDPLNWDPNTEVPTGTANVNPPPYQGPAVMHDARIGTLHGPRAVGEDDQIMNFLDGNFYIGEWRVADDGGGTSRIEIGLQGGGGWGDPCVLVNEFSYENVCDEGNLEIIIGGLNTGKLFVRRPSRIISDDDVNMVMDISQNAEVEIGSDDNGRWCDHGTFRMNVRDDGSFINHDEWRLADNDDAHVIWNIMDNGQVYLDDDVEVGDDGSITVEITDNGSLEINGELYWEGRDGDARCRIGVYGNGSGTFIVGDRLTLGGGDNDNDARALLDVNGGLVEADEVRMIDDGGEGQSTIDLADCVASSLIDISGELKAPGSAAGTAFAQINLHGGRIECVSFTHASDNWNLDICCNGVMVIDGDVVDEILADAEAGNITVCGFYALCGSKYDLMVEYDHDDFPGDRTKIWIEEDTALAHNPNPPCCADPDTEPVPTELCLSWVAGEPAEQHALFLHTNIDKLTTPGDLSALIDVVDDPCTAYCVEGLCMSRTYYWRVDEIWDCGTTVGEIWCFTVQSCFDVDDMEAHDSGCGPTAIYEVWKDGAGDCNGIGGNGSGSSVYVSTDPVNTGSQAMEYWYDSTATEREDGYSEATRALDLNLEDNCEAVLALWFYGDPCNASESMWVVLGDGTNEAISTYGTLGDDDPEDIKTAEWQAWYMDLGEFADGGVDLSNVTSMSIGFGPRGSQIGTSPEGIVFFDDVIVCEHLCLEELTKDTDLNKDCVVDWGDLEILLEDFLNDLR